MAEFHGGVIVILGVVDTAHHTLIVTEKEDGQARHTIDGNEKLAFLILVYDIAFGNNIHGGS